MARRRASEINPEFKNNPAAKDPLWHLARAFEPEPYFTDPVGWCAATLNEFQWSKQREIFESVVHNRYTAVQSCHGIGKSYSASRLAAWWLSVHPEGSAFVVSTAPTSAQVEAILWREISKAHHKGRLPGYITGGQVPMWKTEAGEIIGFGRKPADAAAEDSTGTITAFQGIHARYVLVVLDEACGIPEELWNAVDSLVTNEHSRVLAIGNPDDPASHFEKVCRPGSGWNTITVSAFDSPAFTGEDVPPALLDLLPSKQWVEERSVRWGENSPLYKSKVLGEFPEVSNDTLISPKAIRAAQERTLPPDRTAARFGLDVARFGRDRTVCYLRQGPHVRKAFEKAKEDTVATAERAFHAWLTYPGDCDIAVDDTGVGGGVTDNLRASNVDVIPLVGSAAPLATTITGKERFYNARAEWYWGVKLKFDAGELDIDPDDEELANELGSIQYRIKKGKIVIESKDEMAARGIRSPDHADAFVYAVCSIGNVQWLTSQDSTANPRSPQSNTAGLTGDLLETRW